MPTQYPAHASPRPDFSRQRTVSHYDLDTTDSIATSTSTTSTPIPNISTTSTPIPNISTTSTPTPNTTTSIPTPNTTTTNTTTTTTTSLPPLVSPSFTPPRTNLDGSLDINPSSATTTNPSYPHESLSDEDLAALQVREADHAASPPPTLTPLPEVSCEVRARIPTTQGQEMFLHLYHNNTDNKEHLAIVFGPYIRSKSLDAPRDGETEKDRMIRGAYVGTLFPGRTSSRVTALRREAGVDDGAAHQGGMTLPMSPMQAPQLAEGEEIPTADPTTEAPYVRIHSECYTGETVWSARCDCGEQLDEAARLMSLSPSGGVIIYLRQEGRGIGLLSKLKAYNLQDLGHDTLQANLLLRHPADARSYGLATAMLVDLGLGGPLQSPERERGIRLLTNNPEKVRAVEGPGKEVLVRERVGMVPLAWQTGGKEGVQGKEVEKYISTKIEKFKHMFSP